MLSFGAIWCHSLTRIFPTQTALKMLDGNFPDEHVRKFAVSALLQVPDEELEDILLQLTQVRGTQSSETPPLSRWDTMYYYTLAHRLLVSY